MLEYIENEPGEEPGWWSHHNQIRIGPFPTAVEAAAWSAVQKCIHARDLLHPDKITTGEINQLLVWVGLDVNPSAQAHYLIHFAPLLHDKDLLQAARAVLEQLDAGQDALIDSLIDLCCKIEEKQEISSFLDSHPAP